MDGGVRLLKKAPAAEPVDPRRALVDLFMNGQAATQVGFIDLSSPLPEGAIDLSGDEPRIVGFEGDAQELVEEPVAETGADGRLEAETDGDEAPVKPEPAEKNEAPEPVDAGAGDAPTGGVIGELG